MKRFKAGKKLDALDAEIHALETERRELELQALNAEVPDDGRRARYFSIEDLALRRKAIGVERALHDLRQRQHAAAVAYWTAVAAETRAKLDDLKSESPTSAWRRRIWWDVLTILWILAGAGWLAYGIPGAAGGTVVTAVCAWFIVRGRDGMRLTSIRQGEEILRSSESELRKAEWDASQAMPASPAFSAAEQETGMPGPT
jgi:hypothetical protein